MDKAAQGAVISDSGVYRYDLWRTTVVAEFRRIVWVCLNPSTADASKNDPTIRRIIGFSESWKFGRVDVVNLFALRATDPKKLRTHADPVGPGNDEAIVEACRDAGLVIAAWGADAFAVDRARHVMRLLAKLPKYPACLARTKSGAPKHPLYVRADKQLEPFTLT